MQQDTVTIMEKADFDLVIYLHIEKWSHAYITLLHIWGNIKPYLDITEHASFYT